MPTNTQSIVNMLNQTGPKHRWTTNERRLLATLERFYNVSKDEQAAIFNSVYSQTLSREGFRNGLTSAAIVSQIADLRHSSRGVSFRHILNMSVDEAMVTTHDLRAKIEDAATILSMVSITRETRQRETQPQEAQRCESQQRETQHHETKHCETTALLYQGTSKVHRSNWSPDSELSQGSIYTNESNKRDANRGRVQSSYFSLSPTEESARASSDSETSCSESSWLERNRSVDTDIVDPEEEGYFQATGRIAPILRIKRDFFGRLVQTRPRLLFRAFRPEHGLRARRFQDISVSIPPPPLSGTRQFKQVVVPHLTEDRTYASPFLSWTENIRRTIKLITNSPFPLHLAVVDYNFLEKSLVDKYGERGRPWLVPQICKDNGLDSLRKADDETSTRTTAKNYTGTGEFLSWATVDPDQVIAIFTKDSAVALARTMESVGELSWEQGFGLADILERVPELYRAVFAYKLIRAFQVPGYAACSPGRIYQPFEDFIAGVYREDTERERSGYTRSPTRAADNDDDDDESLAWSDLTDPGARARKKAQPGPKAFDVSRFQFKPRAIDPQRAPLVGPDDQSVDQSPLSAEEQAHLEKEEHTLQAMVDQQLAQECSHVDVRVEPCIEARVSVDGRDMAFKVDHDTFAQEVYETVRDPSPSSAPETLVSPPTVPQSHPLSLSQILATTPANPAKPRHSPADERKAKRTKTTVFSFDEQHETVMVNDSDDDDLVVIGTSTRRCQTVLTIRSRSRSLPANKTALADRMVPDTPTPSRLPRSNKKPAPLV